MNAPIVSFNHVGKSFDVDGFELEAIREFNLEVAEGEFVAIVGSSGCGKSTLLRLLVGLDTQFRGEIQVDGKAVSGIGGERGIVFHVDAAQAAGKVEIDVTKTKVDLLSLSAHKIYGPKGIGALYVRRKPRIRLEAQMHGGGHERGFRSGTLASHQIVGMGEAFRIAKEEMAAENERLLGLRNRFLELIDGIEEVYINGDMEHRYVGNLNISFNFVEGESLIMAVKELAVSSGSACTSASLEPSYVLRALGRNDELAHSSLRITFGRFTTMEEVEYAANLLKSKIGKLRDLSPLWEMHQEGIDLSTVQWAEH